MNRRWAMLAAVVLAIIAFAAWQWWPAAPARSGKFRVLCSSYPMFLFTRAIAASQPDVLVEAMLPGDAGCEHDYALTPHDMQRINQADVFVVNGQGLESYLAAAVSKANSKLKVIDSSAGLGDLLLMYPEGGSPDAPKVPNPHLFADPRMAARVVRGIARQLGDAYPAGRESFTRNGEAHAASLDALADRFAAAGEHWRNNRVVTMHAVFDYLARTANLDIIAVIEETPGQEPAAAAMTGLINQIKAKHAAAVFTEPQYPPAVAYKLKQDTHVPVEELDPAATGPNDPPADYYQSVMQRNLQTLIRVLGQ